MTQDGNSNRQSSQTFVFLSFYLVLFFTSLYVESAKLAKGHLLSNLHISDHRCLEQSIADRNSSSPIILTATAATCAEPRAGSYSCTLQVWRVLKGNALLRGLVTQQIQGWSNDFYKKRKLIKVYGLGKSLFCESHIEIHDTRIFFLKRIRGRLLVSASLLRITLSNLQDAQAVVEGENISGRATSKQDPCQNILCGFGAHCERRGRKAVCVCPDPQCETLELKMLSPICGSNMVAYANVCYLKMDQCLAQRRIRSMSIESCASSHGGDLCSGVSCGFFAVCRNQYFGGEQKALCKCPVCSHFVHPVCGSDGKSYESECKMKRKACIHKKSLFVIRRGVCDPCEVFNESTRVFDKMCAGVCAKRYDGSPMCCDDIKCVDEQVGFVCGNDGNTFESRCALERYACKVGRNIAVFQNGACPSRRQMTTVRGSIPFDKNQCPFNCNQSDAKFEKFVDNLEKAVNKKLRANNLPGKALGDFRIVDVRRNFSTLLFEVYASTGNLPITTEDSPDSLHSWVDQRFFAVPSGIFANIFSGFNISLCSVRDLTDIIFVEDVCLYLQCEYGEVCSLRRLSNLVVPTCECSQIGDETKLAVTTSCIAGNTTGFVFQNKLAARKSMCYRRSFLNRINACPDLISTECAGHPRSCMWPGEVYLLVNGKETCQCASCGDEVDPICASNNDTFRNPCELSRYNCLTRSRFSIRSFGICSSPCDHVTCFYDAQCGETWQGVKCSCPQHCVDVHQPVCGSNCIMYKNLCELSVDACSKKKLITPRHQGICGPNCSPSLVSVSPENDCGCRFGGRCAADFSNDKCLCPFNCSNEATMFVCASNGKTYLNRCEVSLAQCEQQKGIYVISSGQCSETCRCNPYGSYNSNCEPITRQCECRPGVGGKKCNRCLIGYWNFNALINNNQFSCTACNCFEKGSTSDDCDDTTGICQCREGFGGWKCSILMKEGSVNPTDHLQMTSCTDMTCPHNQICIKDDKVICRCPSLATCNDDVGKTVCGSDGVVYRDSCQMKVISCRRGENIQIVTDKTCVDSDSEFADSNVSTLKPAATSASSTNNQTSFSSNKSVSSTTSSYLSFTQKTFSKMETFPATPTNNKFPSSFYVTQNYSSETETTEIDNRKHEETTTIITILLPRSSRFSSISTPTASKTEETGSDRCNLNDSNENCINATKQSKVTSGITTVTAGSTTEQDKVISHTSKVEQYKIEGTFFEVGNTYLQYDNQLSNIHSQLFNDFSNLVKPVFMDYIRKSSLSGIKAFRIISFWRNTIPVIISKGVNVEVEINVDDGVLIDDILNALNKASNYSHNFHIRVSTGNATIEESSNNTITQYSEGGTWSNPQFGGFSYLKLPLTSRVTSTLTINLEFRSFDTEGLLLFASHKNPNEDFFSLSVKGGRIEFRFNTGSGTLRLRSKVDIMKSSSSVWHSILAHRNRRDGMLVVDNEQAVQGTSPKGTSGLNLFPELFVGGFQVEMKERIKQKVEVSKGLTGCLRSLLIKNRNLAIDSSAKNLSFRVSQCGKSPCNPNPCLNSASCFIKHKKRIFFHRCDCRKGFEGENCSIIFKRKDPCLNNMCHSSSICTPDNRTNTSYFCSCSNGRTGLYCLDVGVDSFQSDEPIVFIPSFAGDSYIVRPSMGMAISRELRIDVVFYSSQPSGLIFYNGQKRNSGNFIALNLNENHLEFLYDLGSGMAKISSSSSINLNQWHAVSLSRNMRLGKMMIDQDAENEFTGESPIGHSILNVNEPLYLGGYPNYSKVAKGSGITQGLLGALQKFEVNGESVRLNLNQSVYLNVEEFNAHPCFHQPCQNNGSCYPKMGSYKCVCSSSWKGSNCETRRTSLDENIEIEQPLPGIYFNGNVLAKYNNIVTQNQTLAHNSYILHVTTKSDHGLLLMVGSTTSLQNGVRDYLILAVINGRVHLQLDLGSGVACLVSKGRIDNGEPTVIKVERSWRSVRLQVDNELIHEVEIGGPSIELNSDGLVRLGGIGFFPRGVALYKSFFRPFIGCISRFYIHNQPIRLREDALNSPQFPACS